MNKLHTLQSVTKLNAEKIRGIGCESRCDVRQDDQNADI